MASPLFPRLGADEPDDGSAAVPPPFRVDVEPERDVVRICPVGELDLATVDEVRGRIEELKAAGVRRVVLDLRGVTFMDSTGVWLALQENASARADGWDFTLIDGRPEVARVVELAGVRERLPFVSEALGPGSSATQRPSPAPEPEARSRTR